MRRPAIARAFRPIPGALLCAALACAAADWREFSAGFTIPSEGYCDQPYVIKTADGNWLCTLTTGRGQEGSRGQHVAAAISADEGRTWSPLIDIEPAGGPEASWVVPLLTPYGRVYAFYDYNGDDVGHGDARFAMPDGKAAYRADMLGWYCYRFSDDHGRTWSPARYRLPMPPAPCDLGNQWNGRVQVFWGIDKPKTAGGAAFFGITRLGRWMLENGEGWLYRSANVLAERDPGRIAWELLPAGGRGIREERFGSVQEEHNMVPLDGNAMYCVYRTEMGHPCHSYSADGGRTWTQPEPMTYAPGGRVVRNPRACPKLWKTAAGRFLFWFHNNGERTFNQGGRYGNRNVAWIAGGKVIDGRMRWSQPEIVRYVSHPLRGCSYPDLLEDGGRCFIASTQKTEARIGEIPADLLEGLWRQDEIAEKARGGLALEAAAEDLPDGEASLPMPRLPRLDEGGGATIELRLHLDDLAPDAPLLTSHDAARGGITVRTTPRGAAAIEIGDGIASSGWECDPGLLRPGADHHVVFIVDGGPKVIAVVVDGILCDGGSSDTRRYGWGRFLMARHDGRAGDARPGAREIADISGGDTLRADGRRVRGLRIYGRALRITEAIGNRRAGPP